MGRAARVLKPRVCRFCQKVLYASATEFAEHARLCERAAKAGLHLPEGVYAAE